MLRTLTSPYQTKIEVQTASAAPTSIAREFFTGSRLVTRKIEVRICGPITMIRASGSTCSRASTDQPERLRPRARAPEADQPRDEGDQEDLAHQHLETGEHLARLPRRDQVAVAGGGQRGEAEEEEVAALEGNA